jgi:predicted Zn-dependent protease
LIAVWLVLNGLAGAAAADPSPLETLLAEELDRSMTALVDAREPPYYVALTVEDWEQVRLSARDGTLAARSDDRARYLDVDLRTGSAELDSTHPLRGFSALAPADRGPVQAPLSDGPALRHALWREIDARYREAAETIVVLRANRSVKVEEEDTAPDFEPRTAVVDRRDVPEVVLDVDGWAEALVHISQRFDDLPYVHRAAATLEVTRAVETMVDTEGTRLVHGRRHGRVSLLLSGTAPDGDELSVFRSRDVHDLERLPDAATLVTWADEASRDLDALMKAPRGEPYSGPVLLDGRAAAVFFHEVLGHRVEGHRQKREDEGKTFADQVGKRVLPSWLDVYDDPRVSELAGEQLNGAYTYDDEGVPAQRATIVDDGRFVGFLMARSPIPGFDHSNGHGRRSAGHWAEARMGNTIVDASSTVPRAELRAKLVALAKQQGRSYGYIVDEIEGGFTMTGRVMPNAFNVRASSVWRVYTDGRPDQLIRGLDLVGTPLVAFGNLVAAGDDPSVFNGVCGSDSGWVPVSGVAPSLLFDRLEFQLKEKGQERPPLLEKPVALDEGSADAEIAP